MAKKRALMVGCGDIGIPLAERLLAGGDFGEIWGLRRNIEALPEGIKGFRADVCDEASLAPLAEQHFDVTVVTLTPGEFNDERYRRVYVEGLSKLLVVLNTDLLLFVSSTSVYHQSDESWLDEDSPTEPSSFSGRRLLEAEGLLKQYSGEAVALRFAGIYGPGRRRLIEQVIAGEGSPSVYSNRIHRDDCVGFIEHLISMRGRGEALADRYIGVDSEPVRLSELKAWMAEELGLSADHLKAQAATRRGSKRLSNRRMLETGYPLKYPGFREGYRPLLQESELR